MTRKVLYLPDEYTAALCERFEFDLRPQNLATRAGKAFISEVAQMISQINEGLTTGREEFLASGYLQQKKIRDAYSLYYMTTNLLKVIPPLNEISFSPSENIASEYRILDLGTGTGAASWGSLSYLNNSLHDQIIDVVLSDSLTENLREAEHFGKYFIKKLQARSQLYFEQFDLRDPKNIPALIRTKAPYKLIMMMNVLNELPEKNDTVLLEILLTLLDTHGSVLIIEPATRVESRRLLGFRDLAVNLGATIYSPCTRQESCPALSEEGDWCHNNIPWERPHFIMSIDEIVGTLRLSLKSSYVVLRKDSQTLGANLGEKNLQRVVSERFDEKGRIRSILCGKDGRYEHVINKRDITAQTSDFKEIERYDLIRIDGDERREHDVRITRESSIQIVLPNLGAR
ncbi:MAG: small ribosomal subunit Rsm22 family protein [Ignavibacteriota bacterium]